MPEPAIVVNDIRYAYGKVEAVRGIRFEVAPGEVLGFLGPNGAGKSTTIKILTGQLKPSSGSVRVLGSDVTRDGGAFRARIGVSFEEKNLYQDLSAVENLRFFARLFGLRRVDAMALLEQVGLASRANDRVSTYSKGMRQRLMMARALVNAPEVLFLDEPTDGLDPASSQTIRDLVRRQADAGVAVLLTTHDMWEADELSNRVAFVDKGVIHALDTPENLKLEHGKRSVRMRVREDGGVREIEIALTDPDAGERIKAVVASEDVLTIHTEEATLEQVFLQVTGRELQG